MYTLRFIFWIKKQVSMADIYCALYFELVKKYLSPARSQVDTGVYIFGEKKSTCNRLSIRYIPAFIFWVGKKILVIGQVPFIC